MKSIFYFFLVPSAVLFQSCCGDEAVRANARPKMINLDNKSAQLKVHNQSQDDFVKFFDRFKSALKSNNKAAVCSLISFPIHNLRPFYLPDFSKTEATDTAGLSRKEFLQLYDKVFDDETSWITDATIDSLYAYTDSTDELGLTLQKKVDKNTPVYDYPVLYDHGNNGGVKNLYFGQIKGKYKLFWIACSGNVKSPKND